MLIAGIDPGDVESGVCLIDHHYKLLAAAKLPNAQARIWLKEAQASVWAIESIQSYGMTVGRSVFETCYEIGRLLELAEQNRIETVLYPRPEIARALCGVGKTNDAVVRKALLTRFGGDRKGEPLYLLKGASDKRSAFAAAVYHLDCIMYGKQGRAANG